MIGVVHIWEVSEAIRCCFLVVKVVVGGTEVFVVQRSASFVDSESETFAPVDYG